VQDGSPLGGSSTHNSAWSVRFRAERCRPDSTRDCAEQGGPRRILLTHHREKAADLNRSIPVSDKIMWQQFNTSAFEDIK
jgi:hypothetical protein